jgi:hypothetical protein
MRQTVALSEMSKTKLLFYHMKIIYYGPNPAPFPARQAHERQRTGVQAIVVHPGGQRNLALTARLCDVTQLFHLEN